MYTMFQCHICNYPGNVQHKLSSTEYLCNFINETLSPSPKNQDALIIQHWVTILLHKWDPLSQPPPPPHKQKNKKHELIFQHYSNNLILLDRSENLPEYLPKLVEKYKEIWNVEFAREHKSNTSQNLQISIKNLDFTMKKYSDNITISNLPLRYSEDKDFVYIW